MRKNWLLFAALAGAISVAASGAAQAPASSITDNNSSPSAHVCECGAHPPGPPRDRLVTPYAGEPDDLKPWAKFTEPYDVNYVTPNIYSGAARDIPDPDPKTLSEIRIGLFAPIETNPEAVFGTRMLHGAQLAVEEANARGGYGGKPFKLMLHNDYDNWQAHAVYGEDRPTDPAIWGSASNEAVKMIYDDQDWAIFGSISSESTHIALRVALRAEIPVITSASTDPTLPETTIPWFFTNLQDDRVQGLTLARHIFTELGLKRVALLRINNRYGRFGVGKFRDAARRLGHPIVLEQKFLPGDTDFTRQLKAIQGTRTDAIVLWADQVPTANVLKQMRALGMKQRVFGAFRTLGPDLLVEAGPAAEGFEAVFPYDANRQDPKWLDFNTRFESRFHERPEQFASLAYDAMNNLLDSICKAGLNRARIHDALANIEEYDGVTGHYIFDPNQKNVAPMYLGTVHNGAITYRIARMDKTPPAPQASAPPQPPARPAPGSSQLPYARVSDERSCQLSAVNCPLSSPYARVGDEAVVYAGPHREDAPSGAIKVVLFGPHAADVVRSSEVQEALASGLKDGRDQDKREWSLLPIDSDQNWGAAATELVHDLMDEHALAIVGLDRNASHLSEQLALKTFVPVLAISDDKTLTSTNIPWVFRLPVQSTPATALRLLHAAVEKSGANPEKLRDALASGDKFSGVAFLDTGEPRVP
jgi:ABC-type branched-subunit amino acid transport system substrate-binding protein